ncbi:MAG: PAS domain S-box protein [Acidobacteria bacterium]|nr:PAS domain S-box protein [Acidobacteriota bacterium]
MSDLSETTATAETHPLLAAVLAYSEDAILTLDADRRIARWSQGAIGTYGFGAAEVIGQPFTMLVPDAHRAEHERVLDQLSARRPEISLETVHLTRRGAAVQVAVSLSRLPAAGGAPAGVAVIVRDISDERRAARAMRASEARWRAIIESAVDGIVVCDRRGRIESFNPGAERLFGYRADDVIGRNVSMLMPEPYALEHDAYMARYLRTRQPRIIGIGREVTGRRRDGSTFPIHLSVGEAIIDGESKFTGIVRDLTDRVAMEMKLRQESGLARVGELAAVLAHEVKNPLAAVSGAVQMLATYLPPGGEEQQVVKEVLQRVDVLNKLMSDMLLFARPPQPVVQAIDVGDLLQGALAFFRSDPQAQQLNIHVEPTAGTVLADPQLMKIALQNLLINAGHAMRGRGDLTLRTTTSDGRLHIDVIDHGPGIPPENRERVFTPFFTTKSRGTGLGLPTVRRIAESHRGTVEILESGPDGTTIRLSLPLAD